MAAPTLLEEYGTDEVLINCKHEQAAGFIAHHPFAGPPAIDNATHLCRRLIHRDSFPIRRCSGNTRLDPQDPNLHCGNHLPFDINPSQRLSIQRNSTRPRDAEEIPHESDSTSCAIPLPTFIICNQIKELDRTQPMFPSSSAQAIGFRLSFAKASKTRSSEKTAETALVTATESRRHGNSKGR
jgi:hypothetical protein